MVLFDVVALFGALAVLVKASEVSIDRSIKISNLTGVSSLTVGFLLLAFMTSLPELSVTVAAGLSGSELGVATLFGSNIANMALVFGLMGMAGTFYLAKKDINEIIHVTTLTSLVALFVVILGETGFVFGVFGLALFFLFSRALVREGIETRLEKPPLVATELVKDIAGVIAGVVIVVVMADIATQSSITLAATFGLSEAIIGATIIAVGTSLPEVAVSVSAVRKKNPELAIGNVLGSLVANLTLVLGVAGILSVTVLSASALAVAAMLVPVGIVFVLFARRGKFGWREGTAFLLMYLLYLTLITVV